MLECPIRLRRLPNGEVELWGIVDGIPHWNDTVRMNEDDYASAVARLAECFQPGANYREVLDHLPVERAYWHDTLYSSLRPLTPTLWVVWEEYRGPWTEEIRPIYAPNGDPHPEWNALVARWERDAYLA